MKEEALTYLNQGLAVMPLKRDKRPYLIEWAEYQKRLPTIEEVNEWWNTWPDANIAIICGEVSGVMVVDIDPRNGGDLRALDGIQTYMVKTGNGGLHGYFLYDGSPSVGEVAIGINFQSQGKYVVAAPSKTDYIDNHGKKSGGQYEVVFDLPFARLPEQFRAIPSAAKKPIADLLKGIGEGDRNNNAARLAGYLNKNVPDLGLSWQLFQTWNKGNKPPLPESELAATFRSVSRYHNLQEQKEEKERSYFDVVIESMVKLRDLPPPPPIEWLWEGYIAKGSVTMFTGVWKGGKTSFVAHLLRHMEKRAGSEFLGHKVGQAKTFIMTEEPSGFWHRRMQLLNFGDEILVNSYPFPQKPTAKEWTQFLESLAPWLVSRGYGFVIFDSATDILPIMNENDSGDVIRSLKPLNLLKKEGISILMLHHPSKGSSGADEETIDTSFRGSGAFGGYVENLLTITRPPGQPYATERTVAVRSRYPDAPEPMVVDMKDKDLPGEEYVLKGGVKEHKEKTQNEKVLDALRSSTGMSAPELATAIGGDKKHTYRLVTSLYQKGKIYIKETVRNSKNGKPTDYYAISTGHLDRNLDLSLNKAIEQPKWPDTPPLKGSTESHLDSKPVKRATKEEIEAQSDWMENL